MGGRAGPYAPVPGTQCPDGFLVLLLAMAMAAALACRRRGCAMGRPGPGDWPVTATMDSNWRPAIPGKATASVAAAGLSG